MSPKDAAKTPDCPGCGQGYLTPIGHTGEGEYVFCFMCQRGFSVPENDETPVSVDATAAGPTIDTPSTAQLAAQREANPDHPGAQRGNQPSEGTSE